MHRDTLNNVTWACVLAPLALLPAGHAPAQAIPLSECEAVKSPADPNPPLSDLADLITLTLDPEMFPSHYRTKAEVLDMHAVASAREVILAAFSKYPERVLRDHLQRVYVVAALQTDGVAIGGTYCNNRVYVVNNTNEARYAHTEEAFHHELAGLLRLAHRREFPEEQWRGVNPPEFSYRGSALEAIRNNTAGVRRRQRSIMQLGFAIEYGQVDLDNDFETIASDLFLNRPGFWNVVENSPLLAAKVKLAIQFYSRLDPSFNEAYFRQLPSRGEAVDYDTLRPHTAKPAATPDMPGKFTDDDIAVMTLDELRPALIQVAQALEEARKANQTADRLRVEFKQIVERMKLFRRVEESRRN